jgi:hypothetical protein
MDLGYTERRNECLEALTIGALRGGIPMFGRDTLKEVYRVTKEYDPFEGTGKHGRVKMPMVTFNPNMVKNILAQLMSGSDPHQWLLPADVTPEYIRQITAEECVDGQWEKKHNDNHATDCETMGLTAAMVLGIFRQVGIDLDTATGIGGASTPPVQAVNQRKRGVYYAD